MCAVEGKIRIAAEQEGGDAEAPGRRWWRPQVRRAKPQQMPLRLKCTSVSLCCALHLPRYFDSADWAKDNASSSASESKPQQAEASKIDEATMSELEQQNAAERPPPIR